MRMNYNPSDYTRCEKCKHIDRKNEKCKITNDNWLVSDRAGTCHQFEGVDSVKVRCIDENLNNLTKGNEYLVVNYTDNAYKIINEKDIPTYYYKKYFEIVEGETNDPIKPDHYQAGEFDVIAFCFKHNLDFATGNIIKYVTRAGKKDKDKTLEDLEKAREYLERKIEWVKTNV